VRAGAKAGAKDKRKANKRGAARLAAVQALYQMDLAGTGLNEILAEFESHWLGGEVEGAHYLPAEAAFFRDIVGGVVREQTRLDPQIDAALSRGWPLKRIEAVLRAVLRAGATFPHASSPPNMSTLLRPSSTGTRPVWSTLCLISWRGNYAAKNSNVSLVEPHA